MSPKSMWVLLEETPENPTFSYATPTPAGFYSQKLKGLIFQAWEPWARCSGVGLGSLAPKISLLIFNP